MWVTENDGTRGRRTRAWMTEEYMTVDGHVVLYSFTTLGSMLVHFPGRITRTLEDLKLEGRQIVMPKIVRASPY